MMQPSYGFINEKNLKLEMQGKKVGELKEDLQDLVYGLFKKANADDVIYMPPCMAKEKADLCIQIKEEAKYISVKYGDKNSVHTEALKNFRRLLLYNGCKWDIMETYLRFHYADGSLDGSGENRISASEYKALHAEEIAILNAAFNKPKVRHAAYDRFLFKGIVPNANLVDAILYCRKEERLWASRAEIIAYLDHKLFMESGGVHFSRLFVQPFAHNLNYNPKYEERRHFIQIKWFDLYISMMEMKHKRNTGKWLDVII